MQVILRWSTAIVLRLHPMDDAAQSALYEIQHKNCNAPSLASRTLVYFFEGVNVKSTKHLMIIIKMHIVRFYDSTDA